jgi:endonuclease YncB( thermonuclease family)
MYACGIRAHLDRAIDEMKKIVITLIALIVCSSPQAAELIGLPKVVDGDTLILGATKIRLEGIDAPETDQICLDRSGARWTCGIDARDQLAMHLGGRTIKCVPNGNDRYDRTLATCWIGSENLNGWIVENGWALAYVQYSSKYVPNEKTASVTQHGLWQGAFIAPWNWRHRDRQTEILGALKVPVDAQKVLLAPVGTESAPSKECSIKGNISRNGECIFHQPYQQHYAKINMSKGAGRRWFCSPEEAEAAGCRPARR